MCYYSPEFLIVTLQVRGIPVTWKKLDSWDWTNKREKDYLVQGMYFQYLDPFNFFPSILFKDRIFENISKLWLFSC